MAEAGEIKERELAGLLEAEVDTQGITRLEAEVDIQDTLGSEGTPGS